MTGPSSPTIYPRHPPGHCGGGGGGAGGRAPPSHRTAGLRDSGDPIEQLGVERSRRAMEAAELILVVLDQSPARGRTPL